MEYILFLEEAKAFTQTFEQKRELGLIKIDSEDEKKLSSYRAILSYLKLVGMSNLSARIINGEENLIGSYLAEKSVKIETEISKTKSKSKLVKLNQELANIEILRGLSKEDFLSSYYLSEEDLKNIARKTCASIAASDEYTRATTMGETAVGFLSSTDGTLINEANILLAQEILSGNKENFNKLKQAANLMSQKQRIDNLPRYKRSIQEYIEEYLCLSSRLDVERTESYNRQEQSDYQRTRELIKQIQKTTGFIESFKFQDEKGNPLISEREMMVNPDGTFAKNTEILNKIKEIFNFPIMDDRINSYIIAKKAELVSQIETLNQSIPEKIRSAEIQHMERINYYGRSRIGFPPTTIDTMDATFDTTRVNLDILLKFNAIYKEIKKLHPEDVLTEKEINEVSAMICDDISKCIETGRSK